MLKAALYKKIMARTPLATPGEPMPPDSTCCSYVASKAVQMMKQTNIKTVDVRNIVRRLNVLTKSEKKRDVTRFQIVRIPLIRV
jgi:hypothetical protein